MFGKSRSELGKYVNKNFWRTSSFTSGLALMVSDCLMVMLSIGISFFIINLINHHWINFRSFYTYGIYLPPMIAVFYAAGLYPGFVLPPEAELMNICVSPRFPGGNAFLEYCIGSSRACQ